MHLRCLYSSLETAAATAFGLILLFLIFCRYFSLNNSACFTRFSMRLRSAASRLCRSSLYLHACRQKKKKKLLLLLFLLLLLLLQQVYVHRILHRLFLLLKHYGEETKPINNKSITQLHKNGAASLLACIQSHFACMHACMHACITTVPLYMHACTLICIHHEFRPTLHACMHAYSSIENACMHAAPCKMHACMYACMRGADFALLSQDSVYFFCSTFCLSTRLVHALRPLASNTCRLQNFVCFYLLFYSLYRQFYGVCACAGWVATQKLQACTSAAAAAVAVAVAVAAA